MLETHLLGLLRAAEEEYQRQERGEAAVNGGIHVSVTLSCFAWALGSLNVLFQRFDGKKVWIGSVAPRQHWL
jgi:hypothetical protein